MFYAIYISKAVTSFSDQELKKLLLSSRLRNKEDEITGCLLFHEGLFLQALEGEETHVRATLARIEKDPRHNDIRVLASASHDLKKRLFGEWTMGFRNVSHAAELLKGFVEIDALKDFSHIDPRSAMNLLRVKNRISTPSPRPKRFGERPSLAS